MHDHFLEDTEMSFYSIATEDTLEQSIQFVNERYLSSTLLHFRLQQLGVDVQLKFDSADKDDVVSVVFALFLND